MATFKYDGAHRRNSKSIVNSGVEMTLGDGGNTTEHYYRAGGRVIQIGNGSQGLVEGAAFSQQIVWGPSGCDPVPVGATGDARMRRGVRRSCQGRKSIIVAFRVATLRVLTARLCMFRPVGLGKAAWWEIRPREP